MDQHSPLRRAWGSENAQTTLERVHLHISLRAPWKTNIRDI